MGTPEDYPFGHSALVPVLAEARLVSPSLGFDNDLFSLQYGPFPAKLARVSFFHSHCLKKHTDVRGIRKEIRTLNMAWNHSSLTPSC